VGGARVGVGCFLLNTRENQEVVECGVLYHGVHEEPGDGPEGSLNEM